MRPVALVEQVVYAGKEGEVLTAKWSPASVEINHRVTRLVDKPGTVDPANLDIALKDFDVIQVI